MVKRYRIGIIFRNNSNWVAGTYYIINLIHALNKIDDAQKPELVIITNTPEEFGLIEKTGYPYLKFQQIVGKDFSPTYHKIERGINRVFNAFIGKPLIVKKETKKRLNCDLDMLFPASNHIYYSTIKNHLYWIPDFQEHFLPQFFSEEEIKSRKAYQLELANKKSSIVFSSNDAISHFHKFYPNALAASYVMQFAVTHPKYNEIAINDLHEKYNISQPFFFCPNQVWAHKNHIVVLKAVKRLKELGNNKILVLFSGKEHDNRNLNFFNELKKFIEENNIEANIKFLGFIDREDQLQLMNTAISVIQPSLFEGWSTVIEDVKSIGQYVIASNLPVHKEQITENVTFFNPNEASELADIMSRFSIETPIRKPIRYEENVKKFGEQFVHIAERVISKINR